MPKIVGSAQLVVDDGAGLTIKELVGNLASDEDRISIAHVTVAAPSSEPWLTLHYDEWMCVTRGKMVIHHAGGELEVVAGQSVFIGKGERFRPMFPGKCVVARNTHTNCEPFMNNIHVTADMCMGVVVQRGHQGPYQRR
jgi:mannose-6-phosphate isomerase-like protein (cupin superfamily)